MVTTRGGANSTQPKLDDMKGVSVKRKAGGGVKPIEVPSDEVHEAAPAAKKQRRGKAAGPVLTSVMPVIHLVPADMPAALPLWANVATQAVRGRIYGSGSPSLSEARTRSRQKMALTHKLSVRGLP